MNGRRRLTIRSGLAALIAALLVHGLALAGSVEPLGKDERYRRTIERYEPPDVSLYDQEGRRVALREVLGGERPVLLDFIYGTCTTICPVLSAGFASFQKKLSAGDPVRLVSITIDPEHDRPGVLKSYLARYGARPGWDFLTGSREDIDQVMRAFDAYVPNKMGHYPVTFIRRPRDRDWVRIYGLIGTRELLAEYRAALEAR